MSMEGMQAAPPGMLDLSPSWSADGTSVLFSRVTASTGNDWTIVPISSPMSMYGEGSGMVGDPGMGSEGMVQAQPYYQFEGLYRVPVAGGQPTKVVAGRALIMDRSRVGVAVAFQGLGTRQYQSWGIYGMDLSGSNSTRWYPAILNWVRVSPAGDQFVIPYDQGKSLVFFPARRDSTRNSGFCPTLDLTRPAAFTPDGSGVWVVVQDGQSQALGIGKPNRQVTPIVRGVGAGSFAVSIPNSQLCAASLKPAPGANPWPVALWPGDQTGIYLYDDQGNEQRKLTSAYATAMEASPDGKFVAFMWGTKAPYSLSVAPVDGTPIRRVAANLAGAPGGSKPFCWSPDSKRLVFGGIDEAGNGVFATDIDTGDVVRLSQVPDTSKKPTPPKPTGPRG
jgi:Tol biopolymer transport system component